MKGHKVTHPVHGCICVGRTYLVKWLDLTQNYLFFYYKIANKSTTWPIFTPLIFIENKRLMQF